MIVATGTQDLPRVEELWGRGQANGIEGLEKVGPQRSSAAPAAGSGRRRVGFDMARDRRLFQCLWMWQVYAGHDDYPWDGRTYNCALEPFTSWPPAGVAYEGDGVSRITLAGVVQPG